MSLQPGRNDPCPCGSGKKYKKCCAEKIAVHQAIPRAALSQLVALFQTGRYAELESRARVLLEHHPDSGMAWKILGTALGIQGNNSLPALQKAAQLLPNDAEVHYNLGLTLHQHGQFDGAVASYRHALALNPNDADAHNDLGNALQELGQHEAAVASYRRALALKPEFAEAHNKLGCALHELGRMDDALASYRRALALNPRDAETYNNLGFALQALGQLESALASYQSALKLDPLYAVAHNNLGNVLQELGQLHAAVPNFQRALEIRPNYADAYYNLGNAFKELGQFDLALKNYNHALGLNPYFLKALDNKLFALNFTANHSQSYCLEEARQYGQMVALKAAKRFTTWQCTSKPERLRVGLVSGDMRNHAVAFFLESLLENLDPSRIELIAYSMNLKTDQVTARIQRYFSAWKPIYGQSDEDAAHLIHADGVHVLLDLSGHTAHNRLPLFAWKPAPVQVSWLGYFATTGVAEIDYLLVDQVGVPEKQRAQFTESVWYLPDTRLCFTPPEFNLPVAPLPALANGHITFGCFQNLSKVGDAVLVAWSNILMARPSARLLMVSKQLGDLAVAAQFRQRLEQHGVDLARIELHGSVSRKAYLVDHAQVDVILDTFPYPGGTTTSEALWMGVPTLTLAGDTLLARQGASLLTAADLSDWIANSETEYVEKAIQFTRDLPKLAALRAGLRAQVLASPLFDAPRFARNFEAALWGMWRQHQGLEIQKSEPM